MNIPVNQMNLTKIKILQLCFFIEKLNFEFLFLFFMSSNKYIEQSPDIQSQRNSIRHSSLNQSVHEFSSYKEKMQDLMLPNVEFVEP